MLEREYNQHVLKKRKEAHEHIAKVTALVDALPENLPPMPPEVKKIILFGSYATGLADYYSSVDLCIVHEGLDRDEQCWVDIKFSIWFKGNCETNVYWYEPEEYKEGVWEIANALKEGITIYEC